MTEQEIQEKGKLPLNKDHICFEKGHSMYSLFVMHNHQSSWGQHKCFRCGFTEDWQYDFIGNNPQYK